MLNGSIPTQRITILHPLGLTSMLLRTGHFSCIFSPQIQDRHQDANNDYGNKLIEFTPQKWIDKAEKKRYEEDRRITEARLLLRVDCRRH